MFSGGLESGNKLGGGDTGLGASSVMESQRDLDIDFFTCKAGIFF